MNLYRGCTHGCIYCDSRSACYNMSHDFEDIEVKRNAPQILEKQLRKKRKPCMISTGAMCDPYIQLEEELKITRECLMLIEKYGFGLSILTKSNRILRDIDILYAINSKAKCVVQMTLTTFDEDLCRKIEPSVSTTFERFKVLETMRKAGIPTIVWLGPILPFINDTEENLKGILDYCIKANVRGILSFGFGVTMRTGNREYFYKCLDELFPANSQTKESDLSWALFRNPQLSKDYTATVSSQVKQRYIQKFGDNYNCYSDNNPALTSIFKQTCEQHGILYKQKDIFWFLNDFPLKSEQLSIFNI